MRWRGWLILGGLVAIVAVGLLAVFDDFDLSEFDHTDITFDSDGHILSGTLILPPGIDDPPIALIVHGDGPQDRFSSDGYLPLFHILLDAGIGVFSWDKPGVGQSDGNWLDQSMADRTQEVRAAREAIRAHPGIMAERIGFLGFSQAGWVIPAATHDMTPAFTVLIGAAVNWQRQGAFFTRKRLEAEGADQATIATTLARNAQRDAVIFAPGYTPTPDDLGGMTPGRFAFVARNHMVDASADIARMTGPVLAIWGADDLNVDAQADAATYRANLPDPSTQEVLIVPDATHGLLRAPRFNYQLSSQWPGHVQALFLLQGKGAYAVEALDQMTGWIVQQSTK